MSNMVARASSPATHADANAALVARHLLVGPAAAARWLALLDNLPAHLAEDAWAMVQASAQQANAEPALAEPAAIILGMGNDGHTASLFVDAPQWQQTSASAARYVALQPTRVPHARVGLSLAALRRQGVCQVWAMGADKRATLRRLMALVARAADARALTEAGAQALLMADPALSLEVFCEAG